MAFDNNFIDELKARVNIVDVVGRDVQLKKAGSNFKGLCPFHNEKSPSFMVNEQKQIFNCFGCGEKGDVIHFVQKYHNLTFMEAVEKLCEDYNITMPKTGRGPKIDYNKYYEINRLAARFFFMNLTQKPNPGYPYLKNRGISDETIRHFGLGYAPDSWNELHDHLRKAGVSDADMLKLGLVNEGKNGKGCYDKFRGRVMFPIFNTQGKVIGFGGRVLGDGMPKYLNSSESDIFLKKNNLYGLNFTKKYVAEADQVLMVEGYMDMISLYQSGIRQVVASLGTALTENQGHLVTRYTKNIILSYDSDNAGIKAALRGIDVIRSVGGHVKILRINGGKDPDEFVKKYGKEEFQKLIDHSIPATDFRLEILRRGYDFRDDLQVLEYIRRCVPVLRSLSPVEQNIYVKKLAEEFGLSEHAIEIEVNTDGPEQPQQQQRQRQRQYDRQERQKEVQVDGDFRTEIALILLGIRDIRYLDRFREDHIVFRSALSRKIESIARDLAASQPEAGLMEITREQIFEALDPEEEALFKRYTDAVRIGPDEEEYYRECRARYMLLRYQERRTELLNDLAVAEKMNKEEDVARIAEQLMEVDNLMRKVR